MTSHHDLDRFLRGMPVHPHVLGIGVPLHGSEEILQARYALARAAIERHGYRAVAFESDFHRAPVVDAHISGASSDIEHVMRAGFTHDFVHQNSATREFVEWLRTWNSVADVPVRMYGFDGPMEMHAAPSPRPYLVQLCSILREIGATDVDTAAVDAAAGSDAAWTREQSMHDASVGVGRSPQAQALRVLADDLVCALEATAPLLDDQSDQLWGAQALARTAVGLLRYHAVMATDTPARFGRLSAQRDAMMAGSLRAIAQREAHRGGTIALAHNLHLRRGISEITMNATPIAFCSAGALTQTELRQRYAFIATGVGSAPAREVAVPQGDTVEGRLYRQQSAWSALYSTSEIAPRLKGARTRPDTEGGAGYFPLEVERLEDADGILFVKDVVA